MGLPAIQDSYSIGEKSKKRKNKMDVEKVVEGNQKLAHRNPDWGSGPATRVMSKKDWQGEGGIKGRYWF